ncbi:MAG: Peptidase [Chloroflexi bacterium]|nr:Peptidase [Chloroflexota bacterium]
MGAITDVPGVLVGQAQDMDALTGVTVVFLPEGGVGGVDLRGASPGTRETDLLDPANQVQKVNAITLCGGSAFGLAAATGVVKYLREQSLGFETPFGKVPIVPAAVIFDLGIGRSDRFPDELMGYQAASQASAKVLEGTVGAGTGGTVGKILGSRQAMKSGVGTASATLNLSLPGRAPLRYTVGALVVNNAFGDIYHEGRIVAGARLESGGFVNTSRLLREGMAQPPSAGTNTVLAVIATDAPLTKNAAKQLAVMAHDGYARAINPVHTMFDGDAIFAVSTGGLPPTSQMDLLLITALGSLAAEIVAEAIQRSVTMSSSSGGLPGLATG